MINLPFKGGAMWSGKENPIAMMYSNFMCIGPIY